MNSLSELSTVRKGSKEMRKSCVPTTKSNRFFPEEKRWLKKYPVKKFTKFQFPKIVVTALPKATTMNIAISRVKSSGISHRNPGAIPGIIFASIEAFVIKRKLFLGVAKKVRLRRRSEHLVPSCVCLGLTFALLDVKFSERWL